METRGIPRSWRGGGGGEAMTAGVVEVEVVVLVMTDSGIVVRTSDYLFDSFCC